MNDRYLFWQQQLQQVDAVLTVFGAAALGLVGAWYLIRLTPAAMRGHLQHLYMFGGYVLYVAGIVLAFLSVGGKP